MISLFDLHCDTFLELYKNNYTFKDSPLHISLNKARFFQPYVQVCAIWSDYHIDDNESFKQYKQVLNYVKNQKIPLCKTINDFRDTSFILAVEDARMLNNQIQRLDEIYDDGVRVITLNWSGVSCIGGGWDTNIGLTGFGKEVVSHCLKKGFIIDLSHSSLKVQEETFDLLKNQQHSPIYSHSNAYSICNNKRNVHDDFFIKLVEQGGLVGISLYPKHLISNGNANFNSILSHIEHFMKLGGEKNISLGCDFDGISSLPFGILSISSLLDLYYFIEKNLSTKIAEEIFFYNAYNYFAKNLS